MATLGVVCGMKRLRVRIPSNVKIEKIEFTKPDRKEIPLSLRCRYIEGDLKHDGHWCRAPVYKGSAWCKKHHKIVYEQK